MFVFRPFFCFYNTHGCCICSGCKFITFLTYCAASNELNSQNDRVYAPEASKKHDITPSRLLQTRSTFSKFVMVSVAVSKLGCTELIFVKPEVKVNGQCSRDVLLSQRMLPAIKQISGGVYCLLLPAGHCASPPCSSNHRTAAARDARLHLPRSVAPKQS